jgi:hypothetical protein
LLNRVALVVAPQLAAVNVDADGLQRQVAELRGDWR